MKLNSNQGSVVLSAVIIGTVMAFAAASYIALTLGTYKRAHRSFQYNSALNATEAGAEEAMWALNAAFGTGDWSQRAWTGTTHRTLLADKSAPPDFTDSNGTKGYYSVYVKDAEDGSGNPGDNPTIMVEALLEFPSGSPIRKQIKLQTSVDDDATPGFAALHEANVGGDLDSYDPADGNYITAPSKPNITVASPTIVFGDVSIGSTADIYGHLSVGFSSENATAFLNTVHGSLTNNDTVQGDDGVVKQGSNLIDTNLISYDYSAEFPVKEAPSGGLTLTDAMLTPDANGMIVLGDPSATTPTLYYYGGDLTIPNDTTLLIVGPVQIVVTEETTVGGQSTINVLEGSFTKTTTTKDGNGSNAVYTTTTTSYAGSSNASLELYGFGDISISGNGATTPFPLTEGGEDASKLKVYGTNPDPLAQKIDIGGNGSFVGILYAPAANIAFNGGGSNGVFAGAVIGYDVKVNGSDYIIRYQEGLGNLTGVRVYNVSKWLELTNPSEWHTF